MRYGWHVIKTNLLKFNRGESCSALGIGTGAVSSGCRDAFAAFIGHHQGHLLNLYYVGPQQRENQGADRVRQHVEATHLQNAGPTNAAEGQHRAEVQAMGPGSVHQLGTRRSRFTHLRPVHCLMARSQQQQEPFGREAVVLNQPYRPRAWPSAQEQRLLSPIHTPGCVGQGLIRIGRLMLRIDLQDAVAANTGKRPERGLGEAFSSTSTRLSQRLRAQIT